MKSFRATLVLLVACGSPDPAARLEPGGILAGVDGVTLGAPAGAIAGPIGVTMTKDTAPPTPFGLPPAGAYYRIAATSAVVTADPDAPLLVGLPVPAGITADNAGVAVLVPGALDRDAGPIWSVVPATMQTDGKLVVIPLAAIPAEGLTFAVVARPPGPAAVRAVRVARGGLRPADGAPTFQAICDVTFSFPGVPETCTQENLDFAAAALEGDYDNFVHDFGFEPPWLHRPIVSANPLAQPLGPLDLGPYIVTLVPRSLNPDKAGFYVAETRSMYVSIQAEEDDNEFLKTVRHEYFHATQWAYQGWRDAEGDAWVVEATATSVESSSTSFDRDLLRLFRSPDDSFIDNSDDREYRAQDFWVYVGRRAGRGVDMLRELVTRGPTAGDVDRFLREGLAFPDLPDLHVAYWAWAKNQAYEKSLNLGTQLFPNPCEPLAGVVEPAVLQFDRSQGTSATLDARLPLLTSRLVEVRLEAWSGSYTARIDVTAGMPDGRVKLYSQGNTDCEAAPEGSGTTVRIEAGAARVFYVLIANTAFDGPPILAGTVTVSTVDVELTPPSVALTGQAGGLTSGAPFSLVNHASQTITYQATPGASWLTLGTNASGTLFPSGNAAIQLSARCPDMAGHYASEVTLEFRGPDGRVLRPPAVPERVPVTLDCSPAANCDYEYWRYRWNGSVGFTWDDSAMAGQSSAHFQHVGSAGASFLGQGGGASATSVTVIVDELYDAPGNPGQSFAVVDDGQPTAHIDLYIFTNTCQYAFAASWFVTVKTTYTIGETTTVSMRDNYLVGAFDSGMLPMAPGATTLAGSMDALPTLTDPSNALDFIRRTNGTVKPASISWSFSRVEAPPE